MYVYGILLIKIICNLFLFLFFFYKFILIFHVFFLHLCFSSLICLFLFCCCCCFCFILENFKNQPPFTVHNLFYFFFFCFYYLLALPFPFTPHLPWVYRTVRQIRAVVLVSLNATNCNGRCV